MSSIQLVVAGLSAAGQAALDDLLAGLRASLLRELRLADGVVTDVVAGVPVQRAAIGLDERRNETLENLLAIVHGALVGAVVLGRGASEATPLERELLEVAQHYAETTRVVRERNPAIRVAVAAVNGEASDLAEATRELLRKADEYGELVCDRAESPVSVCGGKVLSLDGARRRK